LHLKGYRPVFHSVYQLDSGQWKKQVIFNYFEERPSGKVFFNRFDANAILRVSYGLRASKQNLSASAGCRRRRVLLGHLVLLAPWPSRFPLPSGY
jgi:hypothetical protein